MHNAALQVCLEAGARHERTLEGVTCKRLLATAVFARAIPRSMAATAQAERGMSVPAMAT